MNRRGLMSGILAAGIAPYVVKAGILMPVRQIWTPVDNLARSQLMLDKIVVFDEYTRMQILAFNRMGV